MKRPVKKGEILNLEDFHSIKFCQTPILKDNNELFKTQEPHLKLLFGDASDRKFYRFYLGQEARAICMSFSDWTSGYGGSASDWIHIQKKLVDLGIPCPKIYKVEKDACCIWIEDLSDHFLYNETKGKTLREPDLNLQHYKQALDLIVLFQYQNPSEDQPTFSRAFDKAKLAYELQIFTEYFLEKFLSLKTKDSSVNFDRLKDEFERLSTVITQFEKVPSHRDYHSRNIMVFNDTLHWIDFQDARLGPHAYDVISLVRDSYVPCPWTTRLELYNHYLEKLNSVRENKKYKPIKASQFIEESLYVGLQRQLKVLGSFAFMATLKRKTQYLKYIKPTLDMLSNDNALITEGLNLKDAFQETVKLIHNLRTGCLKKTLEENILNYRHGEN